MTSPACSCAACSRVVGKLWSGELRDDFLGDPAQRMATVDVSQASPPFCAKDAIVHAHESKIEADGRGSDLSERGFDVELVVEMSRSAITHRDLHDGQMHAAPRPIGVAHAAAAKPLDARDFHVREIARVMNDAHQVRLVETNADAHDGPSRGGVDRFGVHGESASITTRAFVVIGIAYAMFARVERKRRLPLLQPAGGEPDEASTRPTWQWVVFGAVAIFVVWAPLAAAALSITARLAPRAPTGDPGRGEAAWLAGLSALALAVAALGGGFVVGKAKGARGGAGDAALSGLAAAIVAVVGSWIALGFNLGSLATAAIAVPLSALGGRLGRPRRHPRTETTR